MQVTLKDRLSQVVQLDPGKNAMEFKGKWYTWAQVAAAMSKLETILNSAGMGEGAPIGILLRNRPAQVAALMQVLASKRCVATINPFQNPEKIAKDMEAVNVPVFVADAEDWDAAPVRQAAEACGAVCVAIRSGDDLDVSLLSANTAPVGSTHLEPLPDTCILMLTSGTTGPAKRVKMPAKSFELSLMGTPGHYSRHNEVEELTLKEVPAVLTTPLVHIGGMHAAMAAMVSARPIVILEKFSVPEIRRALASYKPKLISLPPTALRMIYDADVPREELSTLLAIRTGSAPLPPEFQEQFEDRYGVAILDAYGATEFAGAVAGWTIQDHKAFARSKRGSVGRAQPGATLRVVDADSGAVLPPNTVGILEVTTPQIGHSDWTRTTDLAELDDDGFLYIRGRADDAIIRGGFKVLPQDVDKAIRQHPLVHEACVVGIPDERLGQLPVAAIQLKDGVDTIDEEELKQFLKNNLTSYQVPARFKVVAEMPRTPSMKISKHAVKELFL